MRSSACAKQGLTRLIGITAIGDTAACRRVIASGRFDSAQVYYNILNPERRPGHAAGLAGARLPRPDRHLQGARRRGHEHPRARGRRARDASSATGAR